MRQFSIFCIRNSFNASLPKAFSYSEANFNGSEFSQEHLSFSFSKRVKSDHKGNSDLEFGERLSAF